MPRFSRLLVTLLALHGVHAVADGALAEPAGVPVLRAGSGCTYATIQAAVDAVASGGSAIIRVRTGEYFEQVQIINRNVELIGGHSNCSTTTPTGRSTINATIEELPAVRFGVSTTNATRSLLLQHMNLINGTGLLGFLHDFPGGGLSVWALDTTTANVNLMDVVIDGNRSAWWGGGIAVTGAGSGNLAMSQNTVLSGNQVTGSTPYGGGLYCSGNFQILKVGGSINNNTVGIEGQFTDRGAGVYLNGCDMNWFAGGTSQGEGRLRNNSARAVGGGLFATGGSQVNLVGAHFVLFGTPISSRPLRVHNNTGLTGGGAVGVQGSGTRVRLDRSWIHNNFSSSQGGVLWAVEGGEIIVERSVSLCHSPRQCSRVFDNQGGFASVALANGADSRISIRRTLVSGNFTSGAGVTRTFTVGNGGQINLDDSLLFGNTSLNGFDVNAANLRIRRTTVASNSFSGHVLRFEGTAPTLTLRDSIIHEPGTTMRTGSVSSPDIDCVVWHSSALESQATRTLVADPLFANPAQGQFYLLSNSPAINYCSDTGQPADLEFRPRGILHSGQPPRYGPVDLGAFELPLLIFRDRFQSSP